MPVFEDPVYSFLLPSMILFGAAALQAATGFGFNLVASPLLVLLFDPKESVPMLILLWVPLGAWLTIKSWRDANWRRVALLLLGAVFGLPLGAYVLAVSDRGTMQVAIGAASIVAAIALWIGARRRIRAEGLLSVAAGLISGVLGAISGMGGPPVILLGLNQGWDSRGFRADLIVYFTLLSVAALAAFQQQRVLSWRSGELALGCVPGAVAGTVLGLWLSKRIDATRYRRVALAVIIFSGMLPLLMHQW